MTSSKAQLRQGLKWPHRKRQGVSSDVQSYGPAPKTKAMYDGQWLNSLPYGTIFLVTPLMYAMVIPLVVLDFCVELYQRLVFPLLGLPLVSRHQYIRLDRHRLPSLNLFQKAGCLYCGYANGLLHYASRVAAETEKVFCPIQHQAGGGFHPPAHHVDFVPYKNYRNFQTKRNSLQSLNCMNNDT